MQTNYNTHFLEYAFLSCAGNLWILQVLLP